MKYNSMTQEWLFKNIDKDLEQMEHSYIAGESTKWYRHLEKLIVSFL